MRMVKFTDNIGFECGEFQDMSTQDETSGSTGVPATSITIYGGKTDDVGNDAKNILIQTPNIPSSPKNKGLKIQKFEFHFKFLNLVNAP